MSISSKTVLLSEVPGPSAHAELLLAIKQHKSTSPHREHQALKKEMRVVFTNMIQEDIMEDSKQKLSNSSETSFIDHIDDSLFMEDNVVSENIPLSIPIDEISSDTNNAATSTSSTTAAIRSNTFFSLLSPSTDSKASSCCKVCYDMFSSDAGFNDASFIHTNNPCLDFQCCQECMLSFLTNKIAEKDVGSNLKCPGGCGELLTPQDVRRMLSSATSDGSNYSIDSLIVKYEDVLKEVIAIEETRNRRLNRTLPSASDFWSNVEFQMWSVGKDIQRCQGCHMMIEKNGGCKHMTCQHCRHEFYWCCGQSYSKEHNKVICFAFNRSVLWGPVFPIRVVTKTLALGFGLGVGVPLATVAGIGYGCYVLGKEAYDQSTVREWLIRREQAVRDANLRALRAEATRQQEILSQAEFQAKALDLEFLNKILVTYSQRLSSQQSSSYESVSSCALADEEAPLPTATTLLKATSDTIEMMFTAAYAREQPVTCPLCTSPPSPFGFITPGEMFRHIREQHMSTSHVTSSEDKSTSISQFTPQVTAFLYKFIEEHLHTPQKSTLYQNKRHECSFLVHEEDIINNNTLISEKSHDQQNLQTRIKVPQQCSCGMAFNSIENWCTHLSLHNKKAVRSAMSKPAACLVSVRDGYLCDCTHCIGNDNDDVSPSPTDTTTELFNREAVCVGCAHPKMLHNDRVRIKHR